MAKKKRESFASRLGHTVSDMANAASVAATGSEIGVLELAVEDELHLRPAARPRKKRVAPRKKLSARKKRPAARTARKSTKKQRAVKRRKR
jgi:hypothetical protein